MKINWFFAILCALSTAVSVASAVDGDAAYAVAMSFLAVINAFMAIDSR